MWRQQSWAWFPGSEDPIQWTKLFSAVRAWGRAHAFKLVNLPFGKPVMRDLISPVFCSSLEFFGSKNIIFWTAHWERVCSPGWMWGMRKGILVSSKGGCARGWWRSTYLVPSCFLKSSVFLGLFFAPDKTGLLCPSLSQQVPLGLIHCPAWKQVEASGWVSRLSGFYSTSWCVLSS